MISKFFNTHRGEVCVIIGNGPSLKHVPNSWLDKYPTFGANRIYRKYTPTFYVCTNPLVIQQNKKEIEKLECEKFIREGMLRDVHDIKLEGVRRFSYVPYSFLYEGYTVTFVSLQLAYYFGFTTVLLVGIDHDYIFKGKPNEKSYMADDDPNHFDPGYFRGQYWNNPDLARSEESYKLALSAYQDDGRKIINLTHGTKLDVFEKDSFENWI